MSNLGRVLKESFSDPIIGRDGMIFRKKSSFSFGKAKYSVQPTTASCKTQNCQPKHDCWEGCSRVPHSPFPPVCQQSKVLHHSSSSPETCRAGSGCWGGGREPPALSTLDGTSHTSSHVNSLRLLWATGEPKPALAKGSKAEPGQISPTALAGGRNRRQPGSTASQGAKNASLQSHQAEVSSAQQGGTGGRRASGRVYCSGGGPRSTLTALSSVAAAGSWEGSFACPVKGQVYIKNICQKELQSQGTGRHRSN